MTKKFVVGRFKDKFDAQPYTNNNLFTRIYRWTVKVIKEIKNGK